MRLLWIFLVAALVGLTYPAHAAVAVAPDDSARAVCAVAQTFAAFTDAGAVATLPAIITAMCPAGAVAMIQCKAEAATAPVLRKEGTAVRPEIVVGVESDGLTAHSDSRGGSACADNLKCPMLERVT